jgi:DNA gyrase subunit A
MIINRSGIAIRLHVDQLRILGRNTQGVRLIDLRGKDTIAAVCEVPRQEDEEEFDEAEVVENTENGETAPLNETPETESEA